MAHRDDSSEPALPIAQYKEALIDAIRESKCLVIVGETGSGKTTQLPQYLADAHLDPRPIVVTQPRRVAAISVAERVAAERDCAVGDEVGYEVRFDKAASDKTRIKYVTDGCLLRECLTDKSFSRYSAVILDEAHIRSLDTDVLFGLAKQYILNKAPQAGTHADEKSLPPPKLIIMSATLESGKFAKFFAANVFQVPGRVFPVDIVYKSCIGQRDMRTDKYIAEAVNVAMEVHCKQPPGDILVFLTGQAEIEKACKALYKQSEALNYDREVACDAVDGLLVLPMYGSMVSAEQQRIFRRAPRGIRKVVVATDIASTSLTIDGIVYVIDAGFVKQKSFNPSTGLDALQVVPVSRSEAKQRTGRAGRTRAGMCFRLYGEDFEQQCMEEFSLPEIQRSSLTAVVLMLKTLGIQNVLDFPYMDPPEERMLLEALRQLYYFAALDRAGNVTELGLQMGKFPLTPSLSRVLLWSVKAGCEAVALTAVAMLCVEQVYVRPGGKDRAALAQEAHDVLFNAVPEGDDFTALVVIYDCWDKAEDGRAWCRNNFVHHRALVAAARIRKQLAQILFAVHVSDPEPTSTGSQKRKSETLSRDPRTASESHKSQHDVGVADRPHSREAMEAYTDWLLRLRSALAQRTMREPNPPPPLFPARAVAVLRQALCQGYFHNVARKGGLHFRTMNGHASTVSTHPSSGLFAQQERLDWVVFHEVVWTSRPYMRTITPIAYSWVKDLLPKLHEVDVYSLTTSGVVQTDTTTASDAASSSRPTGDDGTTGPGARAAAYARRNDDSKVAAARERYLERKRARTAGP
eukprot:m.73312 g.73312  ORF g.73312 m.73312 type:complete len:804 (-) comp16123_c0_seq1:1513-3924(-)